MLRSFEKNICPTLLVLPLPEVQLAEELLAGQPGWEVLHVGRRVHVPLGDQVQLPLQGVGSEGVEAGASTLGSAGEEGATAGGGAAATTPVTTAAMVCLPGSSWMNWPPCATLYCPPGAWNCWENQLLRWGRPLETAGRSRRTPWCRFGQCTMHIRQP